MLFYNAPERTRIRGSDRFAFKEYGCAALEQGPVNNVAMTNNPADIRRGPLDFAGMGIIDIPHAPLKRHPMATIIAYNSFRFACRARCIQNIERVCRF